MCTFKHALHFTISTNGRFSMGFINKLFMYFFEIQILKTLTLKF